MFHNESTLNHAATFCVNLHAGMFKIFGIYICTSRPKFVARRTWTFQMAGVCLNGFCDLFFNVVPKALLRRMCTLACTFRLRCTCVGVYGNAVLVYTETLRCRCIRKRFDCVQFLYEDVNALGSHWDPHFHMRWSFNADVTYAWTCSRLVGRSARVIIGFDNIQSE